MQLAILPIILKQKERTNYLKSKLSGFLAVLFLLIFVVFVIAGCRTNNKQQIDYGKNETAGKYAAVNGIKIYYEIYGEGEPLVMIHGNGGSINSMRQQIDFFSKHYKVIVADSRAQGKTVDAGDSISYDMMADDINSLLDELKVTNAYFIGQSDGAIIGLITAFRYPAKVKMLAAMAPNIRPDSAVFYPKVVADNEVNLKKYEKLMAVPTKENTDKLKLLNLMKNQPHISVAELATIKTPVMIMSGDRDLIQLSHIIEIFNAIPHSNLCVMPGSTHTAIRKNPTLFNDNVYSFFTKPFATPNSY